MFITCTYNAALKGMSYNVHNGTKPLAAKSLPTSVT